jgi:hypothetical protein
MEKEQTDPLTWKLVNWRRNPSAPSPVYRELDLRL